MTTKTAAVSASALHEAFIVLRKTCLTVISLFVLIASLASAGSTSQVSRELGSAARSPGWDGLVARGGTRAGGLTIEEKRVTPYCLLITRPRGDSDG